MNDMLLKLRRLYDQARDQPASVQADRVAQYLKYWLWGGSGYPGDYVENQPETAD